MLGKRVKEVERNKLELIRPVTSAVLQTWHQCTALLYRFHIRKKKFILLLSATLSCTTENIVSLSLEKHT
jgi:hypothetical protein